MQRATQTRRASELTKRNILLRLVRAFPYQLDGEHTPVRKRVGDYRGRVLRDPGFLDLKRAVGTEVGGGGKEVVGLR